MASLCYLLVRVIYLIKVTNYGSLVRLRLISCLFWSLCVLIKLLVESMLEDFVDLSNFGLYFCELVNLWLLYVNWCKVPS